MIENLLNILSLNGSIRSITSYFMYFLFSQLYSAISRNNISKNLILEKNFYLFNSQRKINIGIFFHF